MKINHGEKIAIVGANGAGKTTLVKLLLRLYDTTSGDIIINNQNYKEVSVDSLRKSVGAVFQNVEVYAASIAENIIFREPKTPEDIKIVTDALAFSGLLDFVNTLSQGINTQVTREFDKNGVVFSGGQIQRLAIARGYAQAYELLILDEPSSALDPLAEAQVYQNMLKMGKEKTIVFISHRLTTTVNADRIYLFENGEIVEAGTHNELMAQNGLYKHMFNSQASKYLGGQYENN
jgi:ATP-binding cassette subfamily B protein